MLHDLRYAFRGFITQKGFALVVVLCLGTGIGVNATIFSVVDGVLIQPFDYEDPDRLVVVRMAHPASGNWYSGVSYPELRDLRESTRTMSAVEVVAFRNFTLADSGDPDRYRGAAISWNMFSMLGVRPVLGRDFVASDDVPGAAGVVILSDELWTTRYQANPTVLGRRVLLNGLPHEVIGVMKPGFKFPQDQLLWVPMVPLYHMQDRNERGLRTFARLAPGATLTQAREEVRAIASRQAEQYPATNEGWIGQVIDLRTENIPDDVTLVLWLLMGAATLVLFIACSNAANLLLARATVWAATEPRCANQAFNINNGDLFRWSELWPKIARYFELDIAPPLPMSLAVVMADKEALWQELQRQHQLQPVPYGDLSSWGFADFVFSWDYDMFADGSKARRYGFHEYVETEAMLMRLFDELRSRRIIP